MVKYDISFRVAPGWRALTCSPPGSEQDSSFGVVRPDWSLVG